LTEGFDLPHDMDYYVRVAKFALDYIAENNVDHQHFKSHYIDYLTIFVKQVHNEELKCASTLKFDNKNDIKSVKSDIKKLLIFIPLGIPGMGKSTFMQIIKPILELNKYEFKVVSSDDLRDNVIQD